MRAVLRFKFNSREEAENVYRAVLPEVMSKVSEDTDVSIKLVGNEVELDIRAGSISKLRAAINSYGRWVNLSLSIWRIEVEK